MVASMDYQFYVNQSDKGELVIGADRDIYTSFQARGSIRHLKNGLAGMIELFPVFSRLKMLRQWAGNIDDTPDHSPLMTKLPINGVFLNGGWGTGGFKATPGSGFVFADTIANDRPHEIIENHELFANITTWGILVLTGARIYLTLQGHADQRVQRLLLAFLTLIFVSVCITGYLGGELVHVWDI